ncbi:uncharacterized protein PGRI_048520 [Penicillium griseofulvum]|uniref:SH3 domain-containing protein n=1 Tax=Penicillium patulum TaxID=5078 RepID=A0A135LAL2_PENPA|nr:uncharacterized protein PGRI_048520 [Penicillium griseofulvum]KXG45996.1 hypothetical protein PGRI_048520 [Penicillium griseofulvum]
MAGLLVAEKNVADWTPEVLLRDVQAKREICDKNRWTFRRGGHNIQLRDTADKVLNWLDKFKAVGDIVSNVDPLHAGVPWAGIRFLIQVVQSEKTQMEALFCGLNRICYILYRCRLYEGLLQSCQSSPQACQNLHSVLIEFYTVILRFLVQAAYAYERTSLQRAFAAFWSSDDIQDLENKCQELEARAEIEAQNCDRSESSEARKLLLNLPVVKDLTDSMSTTITAISANLQEKEAGDILKWISRIPYEDHHRSVCKGRTANTGGWLFEHAQYQKWRLSEKSTILWIHGIPGAGKTRLISRVIDHLVDHQPDTTIAYFYCNRYETSRRNPTHVLQSYVKQLSKSPSNGAIQQVVIDIYKENQRKGGASANLSLEESERLVLELTKAYAETILILDAMDETYMEDREDLMEALDRLVSQSANLKVLISSRRDNNIKRRLQLEINLGIEATDNQDDISKFVHERIQHAQQSRHRSRPISEGLRDEIVTTLLEKSEGMFQWAALQIKEILELQLEKDIQKRLGRLPKGLQAAYAEIFKKRIKSSAGSMPEIASRAFQWVLFSFEPLPSDALVAFVSREMDHGRIEHVDLDIHDVLDACCNLLEVDKDSELCRFSHLSVQEYLEQHHYHANKSATSHRGIATVTIQCLLENNAFEITNENLAERTSLTYAARFWHLHARKSYKLEVSKGLKGYISMMFSKEFSLAFSNWLCIHDCDEDDFDKEPPARSFQPVKEGFPGRLYYASRFGFEFIVENMLREDTEVTREANLRSPIVASAVHCHPGVLRQLLCAQSSQTIQPEDVCYIIEKIDGDLKETMMVLLDSRTLDHEEEVHNSTQNWRERIIKEDVLTAAAKNLRKGDKVMTILLSKWGASMPITADVVKTAAGNTEIGDRVITILLQERGTDVPITEAVVKAAVGNKNCGGRLLMTLLRHRAEIPITEDVVKEAVTNSSGGEIMTILLEERGADIPITESVVARIVGSLNERVIAILLNKRGSEITITEDVVGAVAGNYSNREEVMATLLEKRAANISITEGLVARIAESFSERVISILLAQRGPDIPITEDVLEAAAGNSKSGDKIMATLLERRGTDIPITEVLIARIAKNFGESVMMILLKKCGDDIPITVDVLKAAAGNTKSGDKMMMILLERTDIHITEDVVEAAAINPWIADKVMGVLFDKSGARIPITEHILKAAAENYASGKEIMSMLLDKCEVDIPITEDVVKAAAGNYWSADTVMKVLLDKRGADVLITEDVRKAATENENCGDRLMTILLCHKADIPTIEDVINGRERGFSSISADPSSLIPSCFDSAHGQTKTTLPLALQAIESTVGQTETPRAGSRKYLRAFYPYCPAGGFLSSVILSLDPGDIILVHTLHTSGWADGTKLDSKQRGWLPTNYCVVYDCPPMYSLLKAAADIFDSVPDTFGPPMKDFANQDFLRGANAGVRFLLEQSECLISEAPLVKRYDELRALRKDLLSNLLCLSIIIKNFQNVVNGDPSNDVIQILLDEMIDRAFELVTRGARFFDLFHSLYDIDMIVTSIDESVSDPSAASLEHHQDQPTATRAEDISISHWIPCSGPSIATCGQRSAYNRLGSTYDGFLDVLRSLIGLHLQPSSSIKFIIIDTAKQAVQSCQLLLNVVQSVYEHHDQHDMFLKQAHHLMREKISELAHAAQDASRSENLHDEYTRLINVAIACVRAAGDCLTQARLVVGEFGDFNLETSEHETTEQNVITHISIT